VGLDGIKSPPIQICIGGDLIPSNPLNPLQNEQALSRIQLYLAIVVGVIFKILWSTNLFGCGIWNN
jgi:hypothetical protein